MKDWTIGDDGRANTSKAFEHAAGVVESVIRNSAHDLIAGRAQVVARLLVAKLAHEHGFAPVPRALSEDHTGHGGAIEFGMWRGTENGRGACQVVGFAQTQYKVQCYTVVGGCYAELSSNWYSAHDIMRLWPKRLPTPVLSRGDAKALTEQPLATRLIEAVRALSDAQCEGLSTSAVRNIVTNLLPTIEAVVHEEVVHEVEGVASAGLVTERRIYAVGPTPEDAIRALAAERKWGEVEVGSDLEGSGEPDLGWGRFFTADGTGMKAAGCFVPGGAAVLWWK